MTAEDLAYAALALVVGFLAGFGFATLYVWPYAVQ